MSIKVIWDFEDTEYENFQYEEARKAAGLPKSIKVPDIDEDEDICEYIFENYGFNVESIDEDE